MCHFYCRSTADAHVNVIAAGIDAERQPVQVSLKLRQDASMQQLAVGDHAGRQARCLGRLDERHTEGMEQRLAPYKCQLECTRALEGLRHTQQQLRITYHLQHSSGYGLLVCMDLLWMYCLLPKKRLDPILKRRQHVVHLETLAAEIILEMHTSGRGTSWKVAKQNLQRYWRLVSMNQLTVAGTETAVRCAGFSAAVCRLRRRRSELRGGSLAIGTFGPGEMRAYMNSDSLEC